MEWASGMNSVFGSEEGEIAEWWASGDIVDDRTTQRGVWHNKTKAELLALMQELGVNPSGPYPDVSERFDHTVTGSGTTDYIPKWITPSGLGDSQAWDDGNVFHIPSFLIVGDDIDASGNIWSASGIYTDGYIAASGDIYASGDIRASGNMHASGIITAGGDIHASGDLISSNNTYTQQFQMPTSAHDGYLLTSDSLGYGTWQLPASSGEIQDLSGEVADVWAELTGTPNYITKWTGASGLGDSLLKSYDEVVVMPEGESLVLGPADSDAYLARLHIFSTSGSTLYMSRGAGAALGGMFQGAWQQTTYQGAWQSQAAADSLVDVGMWLGLASGSLDWFVGVASGVDYFSIYNGALGINVLVATPEGLIGVMKDVPEYELHVSGTVAADMIHTSGFTMPSGHISGYVLTVDAMGVGRWQVVSGIVEGTPDRVAKFVEYNKVGDSQITDDGTTVTIDNDLTVDHDTTTDTLTTNAFTMPTDADAGDILTSDGAGVGTWNLPSAVDVVTAPVQGIEDYMVKFTGPHSVGIAKAYEYNDDIYVMEKLDVGHDIFASGTIRASGNIHASGEVTAGGNMHASGDLTVDKDARIHGRTTTDEFTMPTGPADGHVLTSDADGNATWEPPSVGNVSGVGTVNRVPKWISPSGLGDSQIYDNGTNIGVNTDTPNANTQLHMYNVDGSVLFGILIDRPNKDDYMAAIAFGDAGLQDWYAGMESDGTEHFGIWNRGTGNVFSINQDTGFTRIGAGHGMASERLDVSGNVVPTFHNTYDLGRDDLWWKNLRAANILTGDINASGNVTADGVTVLNDLDVNGDATVSGRATVSGFTMLPTAGLNRVLTSDAVGVASWENPSWVSGELGDGIVNRIPKWVSPSGLGSSQIIDDGDSVRMSGGLWVGSWEASDPSGFATVKNGDIMVQLTEPDHIATPDVSGAYFPVCTDDNYLYAGAHGGHVTIWEISDIHNPTEVVTFETNSHPNSYYLTTLIARGRYLHVQWRNMDAAGGKYEIYDVSDKANPVFLDDYGTDVGGVDVAGPYAYIGRWFYKGLGILDISNPSDIARIGNVSIGNPVGAVKVLGNYAYCVSLGTVVAGIAFHVVDITDPTAPVRVGTYDVGGSDSLHALDVVGNIAYCIGEGKLYVFDVSDPGTITKLDEANISEGYWRDQFEYSVYVAGRYLFCTSNSYVYIFDVSDPGNISQVVSWSDNGQVHVDGRYLFVADSYDGVHIYDIYGLDVHAANIGNLRVGEVTVNNSITSSQVYSRGSMRAEVDVHAGGQLHAGGNIAARGGGLDLSAFPGTDNANFSGMKYNTDVGEIEFWISGTLVGTIHSDGAYYDYV